MMLFLASIGETRLSHGICFEFSLRPFMVLEVEWWAMFNLEAATSKFCNCSWRFGSPPRKSKLDLCMTNGSKVLIYFTLLYFLLHHLHTWAQWNMKWCYYSNWKRKLDWFLSKIFKLITPNLCLQICTVFALYTLSVLRICVHSIFLSKIVQLNFFVKSQHRSWAILERS